MYKLINYDKIKNERINQMEKLDLLAELNALKETFNSKIEELKAKIFITTIIENQENTEPNQENTEPNQS